jgi:glycosyltransferase involved in cell wall biosynthesis
MNQRPIELSIVVPVREEEENVAYLYERVCEALPELPWELVLVDDGSRDESWKLIAELARHDARVRALERRRQAREARLHAGALELDLLQRHATVSGARIELTPTEFSLLAALLQAHGAPVTRGQLLREVWGYDFDPGTNVVDVHVNRVRRKLEDRGLGELVRTLRGQGYAAG